MKNPILKNSIEIQSHLLEKGVRYNLKTAASRQSVVWVVGGKKVYSLTIWHTGWMSLVKGNKTIVKSKNTEDIISKI